MIITRSRSLFFTFNFYYIKFYSKKQASNCQNHFSYVHRRNFIFGHNFLDNKHVLWFLWPDTDWMWEVFLSNTRRHLQTPTYHGRDHGYVSPFFFQFNGTIQTGHLSFFQFCNVYPSLLNMIWLEIQCKHRRMVGF